MSHDLRSPLAGIRGMVDALADGVVAPARRGRRLPRPHPPGDDPDGRHGRRPVPALPGHLRRAAARPRRRSPSARSCPTPSRPRPRRPRTPGVRVVADDPERWPAVCGQRHRADPGRAQPAVQRRAAHAGRRRGSSCRPGPTDDAAWLRVQDACGGIPEADLDRIFDVGYRGAAARTPGAGVRCGPRAGHRPRPHRGARGPAHRREHRPGLPVRAHPAAAAARAVADAGPDEVSSTKLR